MRFGSLSSSPPYAHPTVYSNGAMILFDLLEPDQVDAQTIFLVTCEDDPCQFLLISYNVLSEKTIPLPQGRRSEGWLEEVKLQLVHTHIVQNKVIQRIKIPIVSLTDDSLTVAVHPGKFLNDVVPTLDRDVRLLDVLLRLPIHAVLATKVAPLIDIHEEVLRSQTRSISIDSSCFPPNSTPRGRVVLKAAPASVT